MSFKRSFLLGLTILLIGLIAVPAFYFLEFGSSAAWTVTVPVAGVRLRVKVEPLLRVATSSLGRRLLDGTMWRTRAGQLTVRDVAGTLQVKCAPCTMSLPTFAPQPIKIYSLSIALKRDGSRLDGTLAFVGRQKEQHASFSGELAANAIKLDWQLPRSNLSELFGVVQSALPELRRATVRGQMAANGTLQLPEWKWTAAPVIEEFQVFGLGTERLREGTFELSCRDQNGWPVKRVIGEYLPGWVTLNQMGKWLPRAVMAAEDARFYSHPGYDMVELMPLLVNPDRKDSRGASTITQQLAKNFFVGADKSEARKLRELLYAVEMERTLGKRRILALYLNTVDWGPGLCGVSDAAQMYFTRDASQLAPIEVAWLAGILRNPHRAYQQEFLANKAEPGRMGWVAAQMRYPAKKKQPNFTIVEARPAEAAPATLAATSTESTENSPAATQE
jgi:hypothetical protein